MKNITSQQIQKLSVILNREVKVNANWALSSMDRAPFTEDHEEAYSNYVHNAVGEDCDPIEFAQCWIVSVCMGYLLDKVGELVIDTGFTGVFWFRKTCGQGMEYDSEVQDAFADLLQINKL